MIDELAWSGPATDDEREDVRRRQPSYTFYPQLDDGAATALVEQILALRRVWLRSEEAGEKEEQQALQLMAQLAPGLIGWAATRPMQLSYVWADFLQREIKRPNRPELHRNLAADSLKQPFPLMTAETQRALAEALDQLEDGVTHPLVMPARGGRRGIARRRRRNIEITSLAWVEWQVARGSLGKEQALEKVVAACGLGSSQAPRNWKVRLTKGSAGEYVTKALNDAEQIGRLEASGEDPARRAEFANLAAQLRSIDIKVLGREYRLASQSRTQITPERSKRGKTPGGGWYIRRADHGIGRVAARAG
jgi:hypothetical protein